jgi:hypothetical protein
MSSSPSFLTLEPPNAVEFEELMKALSSLQDVPNVDLYKQIADFLNENPTYFYSVVDFFCSHASISFRNSKFRTAMSSSCLEPSSCIFEMVTAILNEIFSISARVRVQSELRELNFKSIIRECLKNDAFLSQLETHFFAIQEEQMHYQEQQKQQELQDQEEQQRLKDFREKKQKKRKAFHGIIPKKSDGPFRIPAVEAVEAVKPKP